MSKKLEVGKRMAIYHEHLRKQRTGSRQFNIIPIINRPSMSTVSLCRARKLDKKSCKL